MSTIVDVRRLKVNAGLEVLGVCDGTHRVDRLMFESDRRLSCDYQFNILCSMHSVQINLQ